MSANIERELGRMTEMLDRSREDREEMKGSIGKLHDGIDALRASVSALDQTIQSTAHKVTDIALEKCGERLDKIEGTVFSKDFQSSTTRLQRLETTVSTWEQWMGTGRAILGKLILAVIASGIIGGSVMSLISKVADKL